VHELRCCRAATSQTASRMRPNGSSRDWKVKSTGLARALDQLEGPYRDF
jgi:hypothetical protein